MPMTRISKIMHIDPTMMIETWIDGISESEKMDLQVTTESNFKYASVFQNLIAIK